MMVFDVLSYEDSQVLPRRDTVASWYGTGISDIEKTPLIIIDGNLNACRYIHVILIPVDVPFITNMGGNAVFQDDNACPHRARIISEFMMQQQIQTMESPTCSPDPNRIEYPWDQLGRAVRRRINRHNTLLDLRRVGWR